MAFNNVDGDHRRQGRTRAVDGGIAGREDRQYVEDDQRGKPMCETTYGPIAAMSPPISAAVSPKAMPTSPSMLRQIGIG